MLDGLRARGWSVTSLPQALRFESGSTWTETVPFFHNVSGRNG